MKTRIGRQLDVSRLGAALKRPGIDTRCWVSLAVATGDSFVDKDHGVFVNVLLMPTEEEYTARVSAVYAGSGFGIYREILADDELVCVVPSGEASEGVTVLSQLHSAADLPPQQAIDDPTELMIIVEPEKNLRLATSGGGSITIESEATIVINSGDVKIGSADASKEAARKTDAVDAIIPAGTVVVSVSGGSGAPAVGLLNTSDIVLDGTIQEGSETVSIED